MRNLLTVLLCLGQLCIAAQGFEVSSSYRPVLTSPTTQASSAAISNVTDNSMTLTWTRGSGTFCLVVANALIPPNTNPLFNTNYTASTVFGSGSQIGVGNYVMYKGTGTSVDVTGLSSSTTYYFQVYEGNGAVGQEKFIYTTGSGNANATTNAVVVAPTTQATNVVWDGDRYVHCTRGNGAFLLIVYHQGGTVDADPSDLSTYAVGAQIGTGNFVWYKGTSTGFLLDPGSLAASTTYGVKAYEFNGANGSEHYKTATATGNPLSHATPAAETWWLNQTPIIESRRDITHPENNPISNPTNGSRIASKTYSPGITETPTEYLCWVVGDNQLHYGTDQTYLKYKTKGDGLPFTEGWQWYADGNGDPIPVLPSGTNSWNNLQNWLAAPYRKSDGTLIAYYSANANTQGSRYSLGYVSSTNQGRTWVRDTVAIRTQTSGHSYYQFQQVVRDTTISHIVIFSPNGAAGTEGRYASMDILKSSDGLTGKVFTTVKTDIFNGTQIDVGGFGGFISQPWMQTGRYYFYATETNVPSYSYLSSVTYPYLEKRIILVSCDTVNFVPLIEKRLFVTDQGTAMGIFPSSIKITNGGLDHIAVSNANWKVEGTAGATSQVPFDIRIMSSASIAGNNGGFAVGQLTYAGYTKRIYKLHKTHVNDTYLGTVTPGELINSDAATVTGTPKQYYLNNVTVTSSDSISFPSFTHNQQYLGVKIFGTFTSQLSGGTRGVCEKAGTFYIVQQQGGALKVGVYGVGGGLKIYQSTAAVSSYSTNLFNGAPQFRNIGFVARLNGGGTDIDIQLMVDYTLVPMTAVQTAVFTQIAQTTNRMTFFHVTGVSSSNFTGAMGSCLIMDGSNTTTTNWINDNEF